MHPSELWNSVGGGFKESKKVWLDLVVWVFGDAGCSPLGTTPFTGSAPRLPRQLLLQEGALGLGRGRVWGVGGSRLWCRRLLRTGPLKSWREWLAD